MKSKYIIVHRPDWWRRKRKKRIFFSSEEKAMQRNQTQKWFPTFHHCRSHRAHGALCVCVVNIVYSDCTSGAEAFIHSLGSGKTICIFSCSSGSPAEWGKDTSSHRHRRKQTLDHFRSWRIAILSLDTISKQFNITERCRLPVEKHRQTNGNLQPFPIYSAIKKAYIFAHLPFAAPISTDTQNQTEMCKSCFGLPFISFVSLWLRALAIAQTDFKLSKWNSNCLDGHWVYLSDAFGINKKQKEMRCTQTHDDRYKTDAQLSNYSLLSVIIVWTLCVVLTESIS